MINDMPDGFNTMVGSKGKCNERWSETAASISASQARNTPVLILDESTSALDYITRSYFLMQSSLAPWKDYNRDYS